MTNKPFGDRAKIIQTDLDGRKIYEPVDNNHIRCLRCDGIVYFAMSYNKTTEERNKKEAMLFHLRYICGE